MSTKKTNDSVDTRRRKKKNGIQASNGSSSSSLLLSSSSPVLHDDAMKSERPSSWFLQITLRKLFTWSILLIAACVAYKLVFGRYPLRPKSHATTFEDALSRTLGLQSHAHAIMFDAGSTGTRILVFTFHRVHVDGNLKLDDEYFEEIKPGLSAYADEPKMVAESLVPLMEKAKQLIPKDEWKLTPILLKATAGLRLLPGDKAEAILNEVRQLFLNYPFLVRDNSVSIMDGTDEGLFSWFTVNFLLDSLLGDKSQMKAALDLGGGSTQVTLVAKQETLSTAPAADIHKMVVFDRPVNLYIHSYLGLGLMAARLEMLITGNATHDPSSQEFISPCVHSIVKKTWNFGNKDYLIRGKIVPEIPPISNAVPDNKNRVLRFDQCMEIANKVINTKVYAPPELQQQKIYAMSYYFDRATESGLIDPFKGGEINVRKYFEVAKSACQFPNTDQPFACLDLTYISALLNKGLGLNLDKKITLKKKINGHELSWALGAAFHVLANEQTP